MLTNSKFPASPNSKENLNGVIIGKNAKIGANSTILPGVKIGPNALIGAGAVVTQDVEEGMIMIGNPAKAHRKSGY
ncbi:DapH/DapD/GlmU-related protein [Leptospira sp. WS92.C1]